MIKYTQEVVTYTNKVFEYTVDYFMSNLYTGCRFWDEDKGLDIYVTSKSISGCDERVITLQLTSEEVEKFLLTDAFDEKEYVWDLLESRFSNK